MLKQTALIVYATGLVAKEQELQLGTVSEAFQLRPMNDHHERSCVACFEDVDAKIGTGSLYKCSNLKCTILLHKNNRYNLKNESCAQKYFGENVKNGKNERQCPSCREGGTLILDGPVVDARVVLEPGRQEQINKILELISRAEKNGHKLAAIVEHWANWLKAQEDQDIQKLITQAKTGGHDLATQVLKALLTQSGDRTGAINYWKGWFEIRAPAAEPVRNKACAACTFLNESKVEECAMCGGKRFDQGVTVDRKEIVLPKSADIPYRFALGG